VVYLPPAIVYGLVSARLLDLLSSLRREHHRKTERRSLMEARAPSGTGSVDSSCLEQTEGSDSDDDYMVLCKCGIHIIAYRQMARNALFWKRICVAEGSDCDHGRAFRSTHVPSLRVTSVVWPSSSFTTASQTYLRGIERITPNAVAVRTQFTSGTVTLTARLHCWFPGPELSSSLAAGAAFFCSFKYSLSFLTRSCRFL
jgi:hypothetical protein